MIGAALLAAAPLVPAAVLPQAEEDPCVRSVADLDPSTQGLTVAGLLAVTDVGYPMAAPAPPFYSFSPEGERLTVIARTANPRTNSYCQRLLVIDLDRSRPTVEIARGGELVRDDFSLREFTSVKAGWDKSFPPSWSPDGSLIGYLRREAGTTQVWVADPSGRTPSRPVTALQDDVDAFAWLPDGKDIVVSSRPGIRLAAEEIAAEGLSGHLFGERFAPQFADFPIPTGEVTPEFSRVSLIDGSIRPASEFERDLLTGADPQAPAEARIYRVGPEGAAAWVEAVAPAQLTSPTRAVILSSDGRRRICDAQVCEKILDLWWTSDGDAVLMLGLTGWGGSRMTVLRWDLASDAPRTLLQTEDLLTGCSVNRKELVCARESASRPRRIVGLDAKTGAERIIYDPNPKLSEARFGAVRRFLLRNDYGVQSFADLVLPPDHRPGDRHPLVVVQYESRGFLRGGTGDEVPIHPLATRGFAVLSFQRPGPLPEVSEARSEIESHTLLDDPWADRRQTFSSLERAINLAVATGTVDQNRIGITGFSDGGATVQFALIASRRFRAASMGSCCEDRYSYALAPGPVFADYLRAMGYSFFDTETEEFWKPISLISNIEEIDVPILIQASDSEYESALDVFEAYSHRGKPIEMYVFPNETHYKWQPAHRAAIYRRNVDWFEFWLAGRMRCEPELAPQYERWLAMKGAPDRSELTCSSDNSVRP